MGVERTHARGKWELVAGGTLLSVTMVASSSSRPRISVLSSRRKYAKFHLCKAVVYGIFFAPGSPQLTCIRRFAGIPRRIPALPLQALMPRDAVLQGASSKYWAERRATRDGIRLRSHFEGQGYGGHHARRVDRGRIGALYARRS